jgi:hypothetical protein
VIKYWGGVVCCFFIEEEEEEEEEEIGEGERSPPLSGYNFNITNGFTEGHISSAIPSVIMKHHYFFQSFIFNYSPLGIYRRKFFIGVYRET